MNISSQEPGAGSILSVENVAASIYRNAGAITFAGYDGEEVSLAAMADGQVAQENCGATSWAVADLLVGDGLVRRDQVAVRCYEGVHGNHDVLLVMEDGDRIIMDFTPRQFDPAGAPYRVDTVEVFESWLSDGVTGIGSIATFEDFPYTEE